MARCSIEGCGNGGKLRRGMCAQHYTRWWRHGDAEAKSRASSGEVPAWLAAHVNHSSDDCLKWPFAEYVRGYGQVFHDGRPQYAHRVMCILAHGEPSSPDLLALHICGRGADGCVNPRHIYWGTHLDNARDRIEHGTHAAGEDSSSSILTEEQVLEIRALRGLLSQPAIAALYGITQAHVSQIQLFKRWKHICTDVERTRAIHRRMQVAFGEMAA